MDNDKIIAYVVLSCDPFSDIWDAYGELFNRYWPDCPYDKYLASHHKAFEKFGFSPILIGEDKSWSYGLKVVLNHLLGKGYKYVIPAFDDFMLVGPVKTQIIVEAAEEFIKIDGSKLGLEPELSPKLIHYNDYFGKIPNRVPYRSTIGFAIWNINRLLSIIDEKESAWEFEKEGVERSFSLDDLYCIYSPAFEYLNLIIKRKLVKKNYMKIKELIPSVQVDREYFKSGFSEKIRGKLLCWFIQHFPIKYQWRIYKFISKPVTIDKKESKKHL